MLVHAEVLQAKKLVGRSRQKKIHCQRPHKVGDPIVSDIVHRFRRQRVDGSGLEVFQPTRLLQVDMRYHLAGAAHDN